MKLLGFYINRKDLESILEETTKELMTAASDYDFPIPLDNEGKTLLPEFAKRVSASYIVLASSNNEYEKDLAKCHVKLGELKDKIVSIKSENEKHESDCMKAMKEALDYKNECRVLRQKLKMQETRTKDIADMLAEKTEDCAKLEERVKQMDAIVEKYNHEQELARQRRKRHKETKKNAEG